jgi:preprotein translocase subunit SecG
LFIIICLLLVVVVLLQKGRGGGLGAAFGGAGTAAFGTRTGDVFTWITIVLTAMFLLLAVGASVLVRPAMREVSEPVFSPSPQPIEEPTSVQILCGTAKAKIYYTLDGSVPTKASKEYKKAVMVQPGVMLKAIATGDEMTTSKEVDGYYQLKTVMPELPASRPTTASSSPTSAPATSKTPASAGATK